MFNITFVAILNIPTYILIIKPTRCNNFSHFFLEWNSTCFGQFLCSSSGVFHCTHSNGICHTGLLTACEQVQDGTAGPSWSCSQAVSKPVWYVPLLCVQWKTPDDGHRNCSKHSGFHSKNKFEKFVHLVGSVTRICHDVRSHEHQIPTYRKKNIVKELIIPVCKLTAKRCVQASISK